jgi:hypothetical protein
VLSGTPLERSAEFQGASVFFLPDALDANGMFIAVWRRKKS